MDGKPIREPARDPQDLERSLVSRVKAGDVDGIIALYEPEALLDGGGGRQPHGRDAIRKFFVELVASGQKFDMGEQRAALICGDLALTSTRCQNGSVTAEVARRQSDGTWLWVIDQFEVASEATGRPVPRPQAGERIERLRSTSITTQEGQAERAVPRLTGVVAMLHAANVANSVEFYKKLGFTVLSTLQVESGLQWACLAIDGIPQLMVTQSVRPMNPGAQDVLFYLYATNVDECRAELMGKGISVGETKFPPYSPRGEFRVDDPDGYTLMIRHAD